MTTQDKARHNAMDISVSSAESQLLNKSCQSDLANAAPAIFDQKKAKNAIVSGKDQC